MEIHHLKIGRVALLAWVASVPYLNAAVGDGYVVKADSTSVYLDWGSSSGVAQGDQFDIYRSGEELKHPVTKEVLGRSEEHIAQGVLESVQAKFSIGKVLTSSKTLRVGDRTRYTAVAAAVPVAAVAAPVANGASNPLAVPQELWRSDTTKREA